MNLVLSCICTHLRGSGNSDTDKIIENEETFNLQRIKNDKVKTITVTAHTVIHKLRNIMIYTKC